MSSIEAKERTTMSESGCRSAMANEYSLELVLGGTFDDSCSVGLNIFEVLAILWQRSVCIFVCTMKNFVGKLFCSKGCRVVDFDCIIAFHIIDDVCRSVIGLVLEFLSDFRCDKHSIGLFVPRMIDAEASVLGIEGSEAERRQN